MHELVRAVAVAGGDELVFVRIFEAEAALGHFVVLLPVLSSACFPGVALPGTLVKQPGTNLFYLFQTPRDSWLPPQQPAHDL